jgi:hypothetical protein
MTFPNFYAGPLLIAMCVAAVPFCIASLTRWPGVPFHRFWCIAAIQLLIFVAAFGAMRFYVQQRGLPDPWEQLSVKQPLAAQSVPTARGDYSRTFEAGYQAGYALASDRARHKALLPQPAALDLIVQSHSRGQAGEFSEGFRRGFTKAFEDHDAMNKGKRRA